MTTRLWWVRQESFQATPAALALLDIEERQQHQRYIPPAKRHEYLVTRVLVRSVLGKMLGMPPAALSFVKNEWGRPALAPNLLSANIHFNVSHTDGLVVCLVSSEHEVGVDTELLSRAPTLLRLAPNVFASDELAALSALPEKEQAQRAVHLWTLKESYIKARGMGLAIPLDGFAFCFDREGIRLKISPALNDDGANWLFQSQTIDHHLISTTIARSAQNESSGATIHFAEFDISAF
jgi:4'-phosphopantetheinyl transferase